MGSSRRVDGESVYSGESVRSGQESPQGPLKYIHKGTHQLKGIKEIATVRLSPQKRVKRLVEPVQDRRQDELVLLKTFNGGKLSG